MTLFKNPATTPFNIGERIALTDLSREEVLRYGPALGGESLASRVHYWTNGQPFLTQSVCREIVAEGIHEEAGVDDLVARLFHGPKAIDVNLNLADVANRALNDPESQGEAELFRSNVLSAYERARKGGSIKDDEANRVAVVLKLSGLLRAENGRLVLRNRIYGRVFDHSWIQANMPGQELVRQRLSFRRGLLRGVALAAVVVGVIGALAVVALRSRAEAIDVQAQLDSELYISDMNSLRLFEDVGDTTRMGQILERLRTSPHRGFEWNMWMGRLHDSTEEYTLDYSAPGKIEEGFLSADGRQVCIEDLLASVAVVFDRRTARVLGSTRFLRSGAGSINIATTSGIVRVDTLEAPVPVTEVVGGRVRCRIGTPGFHVETVATPTRTDIALLVEMRRPSFSDPMLELWDLRTGQRTFRHRCRHGIIEFAKASTDGRRLFYAEPIPGADGVDTHRARQIIVWDTRLDRQIDTFRVEDGANMLGISASGRLISFLDPLHVAKVRDVDTRQVVCSFDNGEDAPTIVQIAPDDKTIAYITSEGLASIREFPSGKLIATRANVRDLIPSGEKSEWIESSSSVRVVDFSTRGQGIVGNGVRIAPDGKGAFRLMRDGAHTIERLHNPDLVSMPGLQLPPGTYDFTYNGLWGLVSGPGNQSQIVAVDGSQSPIQLPYDLDNFTCASTSDTFVVTAKDRTFAGVSGKSRQELWRKQFDPSFQGIWITPDGKGLIGASPEGGLASIDLQSGKILRLIDAHWLNISSLNFSSDGRYFLTGGGDGQTVLWDTRSLARLMVFQGTSGRDIKGADISPDGKRVVTCNITGAWQIWDRATGKELTEVRASRVPLLSVVFTSDGRRVLTAGEDGLVRVWAALDRDPTIRIPLPPEATEKLSKR